MSPDEIAGTLHTPLTNLSAQFISTWFYRPIEYIQNITLI